MEAKTKKASQEPTMSDFDVMCDATVLFRVSRAVGSGRRAGSGDYAPYP